MEHRHCWALTHVTTDADGAGTQRAHFHCVAPGCPLAGSVPPVQTVTPTRSPPPPPPAHAADSNNTAPPIAAAAAISKNLFACG